MATLVIAVTFLGSILGALAVERAALEAVCWLLRTDRHVSR